MATDFSDESCEGCCKRLAKRLENSRGLRNSKIEFPAIGKSVEQMRGSRDSRLALVLTRGFGRH